MTSIDQSEASIHLCVAAGPAPEDDEDPDDEDDPDPKKLDIMDQRRVKGVSRSITRDMKPPS